MIPIKLSDFPNQPGNEWLTIRSLRNLVFQAETNGLKASGAMLKIGGRIFFDQARWNAWIDSLRVA